MNKTTILVAYGYHDGACKIEFSETGWAVIEDTRDIKIGYLHCDENSSAEITTGCRDQIIKYLYTHPSDLPGIGSSPQERYFSGLKIGDLEKIGNCGEKAYYNY